jgi:hypothetical protein
MFSPLSRYHPLPDIVTTDARGRTLASKTLRPLPPVSGTLRHTVEDADRLDQLAYRYYREPRKWWRLLDANPEFLSPQALLGKEPIVTDRFPLTFEDGRTRWPALMQLLMRTVGVEEVRVHDEIQYALDTRIVRRQRVTVHAERFERAVLVTYNQLNVSAEDLTGLMTAAGFATRPPERLGRVGKQIVVPRDVTG